jgi:DNA-binding transcriptional ArsR family regulator
MDADTQMPDRVLELIAHRFKLLSEPMRLRLLRTLMSGEKNVSELVTLTGASQANVSKHLGVLAAGGLVARRKAGISTFYRVADPSLGTLCDLVCRSLADSGEQTLHLLKAEDVTWS